MPENYLDATNKWFELATDAYRTYIKSLVWSQERVLEVTKTLAGQADKYQDQSKGLVDEYANQVQRAQELTKSTWQQMLKNTTEVVNQYRATTNANIAEVNERVGEFQKQVESAAKPSKKSEN
jgi:polyhydroxyalkanoate synthesis regulator phasin